MALIRRDDEKAQSALPLDHAKLAQVLRLVGWNIQNLSLTLTCKKVKITYKLGMDIIHQPVVAGVFYPDDPDLLKQTLKHLLDNVSVDQVQPRAIIAPHAGYIYSGEIAASVYARLRKAKQWIKKVILIGPSHRVSFAGLALSSAEQFLTPLGSITVDTEAVKTINGLSYVKFMDQVYDQEHSLEVHLPFLQTVIDSFTLVPVIAGMASAQQVCELIELFWGDPEILIVISSDLSHFLDYETAQKKDRETSDLIEQLNYEQLDVNSACGRVPISGLLKLARKNKLRVQTVDLRNSGDTAGNADKTRVVGYGAYVIE